MAGPVKRAGSLNQTDTKGNEIGKVFVGGLSWDTSEDTLKESFSKFGEVTDCIVMRNAETGNSRGFGFLTFRDSDSVEMVLAGGPHIVDGRHVDAKACNKKVAAAQRQSKKTPGGKENKVFVGGLPIDVTEDVMRDFFNQFGNVTEVLIMFNQQKQRPRGFGFVSFDGEESIEHLVQQHYLTMNGKQIEIKRAEPRFNKPGFEGGAMGGAPEPWMSQGAGDIWGGGVDQYAMNGAGAGAYPAPDYSQYAQAGAGYQASTAAYQQAWSQVASQAGAWPQVPPQGGPAMAGYGQQPAAAYGWPPQTAGAPQSYGPYSQQPQAGYGVASGGQPVGGPPGAFPGAAGYGSPPAGPPGPPAGQGPSAPQGAYGQESSGFGPQRGGYGGPPGPASGAAGQGMYGADGSAPGYGPPGGAVQPNPAIYGGGAPGGDSNAGYGRAPAGGGGGQQGYHPYRR